MKKITLNILTFFILFLTFTGSASAQLGENEFLCGFFYPPADAHLVNCDCGSETSYTDINGVSQICCGWVVNNSCSGVNPNPGSGGDINIDDVSNATFDAVNPLKIAGSPVADKLSTPGGILSRLLSFLFPIAGLILFVMIVWGGFEILLKASDSKGLESGKNRITAAIVGFLLLFSSYWIVQIIEVIFGLKIL